MFERKLDQVVSGLDGGILAEDVGIASGRHRAKRGLGTERTVVRRSRSEIESEMDPDVARVAAGGGEQVRWRILAVWPNPRRLALVVIDQGPRGVVGGEDVRQTVDSGSDSVWVKERAEADATVVIVGHLVVQRLLVEEDARAIETPDRKPRGLGSAGVADILGRLDAEGIAAETTRATAGTRSLGFSA